MYEEANKVFMTGVRRGNSDVEVHGGATMVC